MTPQPTAKKAQQCPLELGAAIAIGTALAASVSPSIGVGVVFVVLALRKTEQMTAREGLKLAAMALAAGVAVAAGISVIENWAAFKEGFEQGYQSR